MRHGRLMILSFAIDHEMFRWEKVCSANCMCVYSMCVMGGGGGASRSEVGLGGG